MSTPICQDCGVEMVTIQGPGRLMTVKCPQCGEGWNPATEPVAVSTPNPTHIIADAVHAGVGGLAGRYYFVELAEYVVSKLTDAGYSIVQVCRYCSNPIEHSLGRWRHTGNGFGMLTCTSEYRDAGGNYRFAAPAAAEGEKP